MKSLPFLASVSLLLAVANPSRAFAQVPGVVSDGHLGALVAGFETILDMASLAPDGVFHFTTIHIPSNTVVRFLRQATNTPAFLAATGDILIEGTLLVSATDFYPDERPVPGGGEGGLVDNGATPFAGGGPSGGQPGGPAGLSLFGRWLGNAGGGGGMATAGQIATSHSGPLAGLGGAAIPRPVLTPGVSG
ncbi:MAG: hypothetical protein ACKO3N_08815, partial [Verrucomicrobiota bacterium]